jgi:hypothetical protein
MSSHEGSSDNGVVAGELYTGRSMRHPTPPPVPTPELVLIKCDGLEQRVNTLTGTVQEVRDIMLELAGRSGKDGRMFRLEEQLRDSRESQGKRLGDLEQDMAAIKATRAQLRLLGAVAMLVLGAIAGALATKFLL